MKKKIAAVVMMFMLFAGVVHASSINGEFNGNPIVNVKSDGRTLTVQDAPAIVYEGRTYVPIYMLKELGAVVKWNQDTYTVDVDIPKSKQSTTSSIDSIAKILGAPGSNVLKRVRYTSYGEATTFIEFDTNFVITDSNNAGKYSQVLLNASTSDADNIQLNDTAGNVMFVKTQDVRDFYNRKISDAELQKKISIQNINQSTPNQSAPAQPAPSQTPPSTSGGTVTPSAIESKIDGDFEGWDGETIFKLSNGQIWQQDSYAYTYHYAYMPKVLIYKDGTRYKMKVDGVADTIYVKRLK